MKYSLLVNISNWNGFEFTSLHFNNIILKFGGNNNIKSFICWNQLLALIYSQLCNCESFHYVIVSLKTHHLKCYYLKIRYNPITKITYTTDKIDIVIFLKILVFHLLISCNRKNKWHVFFYYEWTFAYIRFNNNPSLVNLIEVNYEEVKME